MRHRDQLRDDLQDQEMEHRQRLGHENRQD